MINAVNQLMNQKTVDQYKVIEEKYLILKRYLKLYFDEHTYMMKEDVNLILKALDSDLLETITKLYDPTGEVIEEEQEEISEENSN